MSVPAEILRCPVHGMTDCSPLLNGCSIPNRLAEAYRAGYDAGKYPAETADPVDPPKISGTEITRPA